MALRELKSCGGCQTVEEAGKYDTHVNSSTTTGDNWLDNPHVARAMHVRHSFSGNTLILQLVEPSRKLGKYGRFSFALDPAWDYEGCWKDIKYMIAKRNSLLMLRSNMTQNPQK